MKNNHNREFDGTFYPASPVIGRFVSPWDTSGWYSVYAGFGVGAKLHSNEEVTAVSVPERFVGADYIMTFNSTADGFDDKQEVDFFCERASLVAVALDAGVALPEWASEFAATNEQITGSDGRAYRIVEKQYAADTHVHIPGLHGEGNHFFVLAIPAEEEPARPLPAFSVTENTLSPYEARDYRSYLVEVFNRENALDAFDFHDCALCYRETDERDGYVRFENGGYLSRAIDGLSDRIVMSAKVSCRNGLLVAAIIAQTGVCAGVVLDEGMVRTPTGDDIIAFEKEKEVALRLVLDSERGEYDVWVNSRKLASGLDVLADGEPLAVAFSCEGEGTLDNLYVFDDTEIDAVCEDFRIGVSALLPGENAHLVSAPIPFASDPSAALSSADSAPAAAEYLFAPMSGVASIELKVHASDAGFVQVPVLTDGQGNVACRVALYKNCLYATDGDRFVEIYEGLTDFQYYPHGNWYRIKLMVNTEASTYTLMVDGAVRAKDFALSYGVEEVSRLVFSAEGETTLLVNSIRIYDAADFSRGVIPAAQVFNVRDYGTVGDGKTLDTKAIQKALDEAAYTGGTVYFPAGTYLTGELFLRSDETVFVSEGATVLGTQDHGEYPLMEPRSSLCAHRQLGRGLFYGENISNVRITGGGMLDGNGRYRFKMNDPLADRRVLDARPDIVYITYSDGITVENIHMKSSAFWTVVPLSSSNVILRGLDLDCMNTPNRDGIDPVDCHDMTIYHCNIMAGDDGLCFKSSDPVGCYHIYVDDMMIQSLASGIKFGTDTYYALRDARIGGCTVKNVNRCGVSLETVDGAAVENVLFEKIDMTDVGAPVYITVGCRNRLPRAEGIPERTSFIRGVTFRDLRFEKPYPFSYTKNIREVMVVGQSESQRIEDVTFERCHFVLPGGFSEVPGVPRTIDKRYPEYDRHGLSAGAAFTVRFAKNFRVLDSEITLESPDVRPMTATFDVE